jgi:mRNA interferase MazF
MNIKRGDIVLVNLDPVVGSEQGKTRPALIIQNDTGNQYSPTTIVAPITSKVVGKEFPFIVRVLQNESGLKEQSVVMLNQIRTIDKSRIVKRIGKLNVQLIKKVDLAIKVSLSLD